MPWLLSAGGSVDNLTSDESKESMTYLKDLMDKGYISKECINWTLADAEKQFASGQAAMMINGPWQFSGLLMMLRIWNMEWLKFRKQMMEIMLLYLVERT